MAVLSVAITLSFHLNARPTDLERRVSKPLGAVFWLLGVVMLALGLVNYINGRGEDEDKDKDKGKDRGKGGRERERERVLMDDTADSGHLGILHHRLEYNFTRRYENPQSGRALTDRLTD
ncbi:uncharacterized protein MAM_03845 [Metarhizium album ARSEF 1941]|uniref:DUF202 domain-containing protein n=1 Tax=Metarhizium album (strain ARSEF 1941) TaxID=1081103 RepID=A0A0B2WWV2_METAS|nr:uncharacterized protein MAM_03845 [Metarhizium album ARSEF 1941]KHN98084.1 hypothetical protein MAM_03845 [Metarhizium album ARSEF 1941]